uniref:Putative ovule protein n=1 Tax=Solanum chacoense TaxID=4108 RepID=A0A0V0HPJ6_SOLCH
MITATTMATGGSSSVFLSVPTPPPQKLQILSHKQLFFTNKKWSTLPFLCSSSTSSTPLVEEEEKENGSSDDVLSASINEESSSILPPGACKGCGRVEIESGCNGEGRIQGGIATVPGFGWWPIKAYRPCPAFVASGGRYKRFGQSMDEVVSGKGGRVSSVGTDAEVQSSTKKNGTKRSKS